ncbi:MAG: hypothetical protein U0164_24115 [Gemmatimonadaceae bacterium]
MPPCFGLPWRAPARLLRAVAPLAALALGAASAPNVAPRASRQAPPLRVLFIGNSYTYFNNLPALVADLGQRARAPRTITTRMIVRGGATLRDHWTTGEALDALRREHWDFVVLQEQSMLGTMLVDGKPSVNDPAFFQTYARLFVREIRAAHATPVFYLTWSRKGSPEAQQRLTNAYADMARESGALLAPVGLAWQEIRRTRASLELYDPDGSHPSPNGSYVAAATLLATMTGVPARGLPARAEARQVTDSALGTAFASSVSPIVTLADSDAALVQGAVDGAVGRVRPTGAAASGRAASAALAALLISGDTTRLPSLPAGAPLSWTALAGEWHGTMRLYDEPVEASLVIEPRDSTVTARWSVRGARWSASSMLYEPSLEASRLRFTVADMRFLAPPESHWAVLQGDTLVGRAEVGGGMMIPHLLGSWRLVRTRDPARRAPADRPSDPAEHR